MGVLKDGAMKALETLLDVGLVGRLVVSPVATFNCVRYVAGHARARR